MHNWLLFVRYHSLSLQIPHLIARDIVGLCQITRIIPASNVINIYIGVCIDVIYM